jgi:LAO/AO transport system kinase
MTRPVQPETLIPALLGGDRRALARAITQIENETAAAATIMHQLYPHTGRAILVGMTGAPGTGKSSLVNGLAKYIRQQGQQVAIVAVDPSSPFSRGAVLGDRIRMQDHVGDEGVFIRSMASRGSLGGLAPMTVDVVRVLDAAGFDVVITETVGAGQNEVAIAGLAQTTIVVEAPGLGDDIQANKAGILEIADILVVNKADNPLALRSVQTLKAMLELGHRLEMVAHHGPMLLQQASPSAPAIDTWQVPVLTTTAINNEGLPALYHAILEHQAHLESTGRGIERQRSRLEAELAQRLQAALLEHFLANVPAQALQETLTHLTQRQIPPSEAVQALVTRWLPHAD